ncbi:hypothetical protein ACX6XY_11850 [Streptomyces sp. O3]
MLDALQGDPYGVAANLVASTVGQDTGDSSPEADLGAQFDVSGIRISDPGSGAADLHIDGGGGVGADLLDSGTSAESTGIDLTPGRDAADLHIDSDLGADLFPDMPVDMTGAAMFDPTSGFAATDCSDVDGGSGDMGAGGFGGFGGFDGPGPA